VIHSDLRLQNPGKSASCHDSVSNITLRNSTLLYTMTIFSLSLQYFTLLFLGFLPPGLGSPAAAAANSGPLRPLLRPPHTKYATLFTRELCMGGGHSCHDSVERRFCGLRSECTCMCPVASPPIYRLACKRAGLDLKQWGSLVTSSLPVRFRLFRLFRLFARTTGTGRGHCLNVQYNKKKICHSKLFSKSFLFCFVDYCTCEPVRFTVST